MLLKLSLLLSSILVANAQFFGTDVLGEDPSEDPVFTLGDVTFGGDGCPNGSVQVQPSSDEQTLSVFFDQYVASTGRRSFDRKSCNLAVPVDVKQGYSIGLFKVDYRGYAYLYPSGDNWWRSSAPVAQFNAEYFFAGKQGPKVEKKWDGGGKEHFEEIYISNEVVAGAIVWSPCGASTNFRINTAVTARGKDAEIGIESTDVTVEDKHHDNWFRYYFRYEECTD